MIVNHDSQRVTGVGDCRVSSVHYSIVMDDGMTTATLNETCLFWQNGDSRIVGDYDAHDAVVATLNSARDWWLS